MPLFLIGIKDAKGPHNTHGTSFTHTHTLTVRYSTVAMESGWCVGKLALGVEKGKKRFWSSPLWDENCNDMEYSALNYCLFTQPPPAFNRPHQQSPQKHPPPSLPYSLSASFFFLAVSNQGSITCTSKDGERVIYPNSKQCVSEWVIAEK